MIKERTRLFKERAEAEIEHAKQERERKKRAADHFLFGMYFIAFSAFIFCFVMAGIGIYGAIEEQKIYEKKVQERLAVIRRQAKEREAAEKKEREDYAKR